MPAPPPSARSQRPGPIRQAPAEVIGYGLHPETFPGTVTVCRPCLPAPDRIRFEDAYGSDALGEIAGWTVNDEAPVLCDVCASRIHPGATVPGGSASDSTSH